MKYLKLSFWIKIWKIFPPVLKLGIGILIFALVLTIVVQETNRSREAIDLSTEVESDEEGDFE